MYNTLYTSKHTERITQLPSFKQQINHNLPSNSYYRQRSLQITPNSGDPQKRTPIRIFENPEVKKSPVFELNAFNPLTAKPFNRSKTNIDNSTNSRNLFAEKHLEDIDEIEQNNEECSINMIPVSPIFLKHMTRPSLNLSHEPKFDTCHLSTEPSVSSINTTPPQGVRRMPYLRDLNETIYSDFKPPSAANSYRHRLSAGSLPEGNSGQKSGKKIFDSASKDEKCEAEEASINIPKSTNNLATPNKPESLFDEIKETYKKYRRASQPVEIESAVKNTPPKVNRSTTGENNTKTPSTNSTARSHNISIFSSKTKNSNLKSSRTSIDERNSATEGMKRYFSSLNNLEMFDPKTWIKQILITDPRKNIKCTCDSHLPLDKTCSSALRWISKRFKPEEFDYLKNTYERILSEQRLAEPEQVKQIQKDVNRTFPGCKFYEAGSEGLKTLERVLGAVAKYDPGIGYVQGMNFIVGSLLYHAEEYLAFWIMVTIFEILEMRDIYLPRLPGLSKHCQIVDMLIFNHQPTIYSKLCEYQIKAEMFCSEWILTLFGSVVPIENMGLLYDNLLDKGWPFFYKLILAFLENFQKDIEEQTDIVGVLTILKSQNHISSQNKTKSPYYIDWKDLCKKANEIELDADFIYDMHLKFDINNLWFRTTP